MQPCLDAHYSHILFCYCAETPSTGPNYKALHFLTITRLNQKYVPVTFWQRCFAFAINKPESVIKIYFSGFIYILNCGNEYNPV